MVDAVRGIGCGIAGSGEMVAAMDLELNDGAAMVADLGRVRWKL
jgi:hypothetical protein